MRLTTLCVEHRDIMSELLSFASMCSSLLCVQIARQLIAS